VDEETRRFLSEASARCSRIRFHGEGVAYARVPEVLRGYHVGLLLHRPRTINYVYNATNKLFEYLACGLNVIDPREMLGVRPYARAAEQPRVIAWDFEDLPRMDYGRDGRLALPVAEPQPACEAVFQELEKRASRSI
jgi:hypothetical protein